MASWPISISEAARRLRIPINAAGVMVRSHNIPTVKTENNNGKGLTPEGFARLEEAARAFVSNTDRIARVYRKPATVAN